MMLLAASSIGHSSSLLLLLDPSLCLIWFLVFSVGELVLNDKLGLLSGLQAWNLCSKSWHIIEIEQLIALMH